MGFFKNIGKKIKSFAKKNINFKTLVKVGGMVDPSGLVGGLQAAHYAKKEGKEAEAQAMAQQAGSQGMEYLQNNTIFGGAIKGATGQVGATAVDSTMSTWLKSNWWKVLIPIVGIVLIVKFMRPQGRRSGYRR